MPVDIKDKGRYELFETTHQHRILVLNDKQRFAAVEGQQGDILVRSDSDHKKAHTIQKGQFYVIDFRDDPKFKDMPHLFLEKDAKYQELMIPNGLPTGNDHQKKVVWTDETITKKDFEKYLEEPAPAGPGEERMDRPGGGAVANVAHHLKGIDLPAKKDEVIQYAKRKDAPKAVIDQLEKIDEGLFKTMADIMKGLGGEDSSGKKEQGKGGGERQPLNNYDEMTVDEVTDHLNDLSDKELDRIRHYEEQHKNRKTVLEAVDRKHN